MHELAIDPLQPLEYQRHDELMARPSARRHPHLYLLAAIVAVNVASFMGVINSRPLAGPAATAVVKEPQLLSRFPSALSAFQPALRMRLGVNPGKLYP